LAGSIRGAMCGYGVFHASPAWGFPSLAATATTAIASGIVSELYALDGRVASFDLAKPLAIATLVVAPLAVADFALAVLFALDLDLSVVASCCSVQLDSVAAGTSGPVGLGSAARTVATTGAVISVLAATTLATFASRHPTRARVLGAGAAAVVAAPFALAAAVLMVAPYAFEVPQHVCPFCLLRPSVYGLGYPLFGAILIAVTCGASLAVATLLAKTDAARGALALFARRRLKVEALTFGAALLLGILPVARYAWVSDWTPLFR
jgi:hypothetical protein